MAQASNTTGRRTITLPKTPRNTRAALKQAEKPAAPKEPTPRHDEPLRANESVWITALAGAGGFHRDALQLELAVGLSVFSVKADASKVPLDAKKALREIYTKAGYATATPQGEDYKTVNRRINVAADLYQFIGGRETIVDWVGDASPREQVKSIMEHVKKFGFDSVNDVLAHMGKAVAVKRPRTGPSEPTAPGVSDAAKAASAALAIRQLTSTLKLPEGRVFSRGPITVAIPVEATYEDVMAIVGDLSVFAATKLRQVQTNEEPAPAEPAQVKTPEQALAAA